MGTSTRQKQTPAKHEHTVKRRRLNGAASSATPTSAANIASTPRFFTLPRELRDQIYAYNLEGKPAFNVQYGGFDFQISHESSTTVTPEARKKKATTKRKRKSPAPWLYTNKQILYEAIEEFQRHCTWSTSCDLSAQPPKDKISQPHRSAFLLSPWKARALRLVNQRTHELFELTSHGKHCNVISRVAIYSPELPRLSLLHSLIPAEPRLSRLHIDLDFFGTSLGVADDEPPVEVDFETLAALSAKSVRNVVIHVVFRMSSRGGEVQHARLMDEFSSLGMRLVGGDGKQEFETGGMSTGELVWRFEFTMT